MTQQRFKRTNAPTGYRPEEVCEIRDIILRDLDGSMAETLDAWDDIARMQGMVGPTDAAVEKVGLDTAKLFWVPPEETAAIIEGAGELPEDMTLTADMVPAPSGFVVFGGLWYGTDAKTGETTKFPIRAIRWGPVLLPTYFPDARPDGGQIVRGAGIMDDKHPGVLGIAISAYSATFDMVEAMLKMTDDELDRSVVSMGFVANEQIRKEIRQGTNKNTWLPLGRSDWTFDENWRDHICWSRDSVPYASVIEDRCIIAALWGLMQSCPPQDLVPNRAQRRQAERRGREAAPVRVVTWRGPRGERVASDNELTEGRHLTKRFVVKSHWRHQAWGPGRKFRKWILVPRHWRGPEDGEVADPHEIINKVVKR